MIYRMLDMDAQIERQDAIASMVGQIDFTYVHGQDETSVHSILMNEFSASDPGGTGLLSSAAVLAALSNSQLGLSQMEINSLISASEVTPEGQVAYASLASYAFYILQYLAQEAALR